MTNESIITLVAACCGVFGLAAFIAFVLVPAWTSYWSWPQRLAATFLSLYVLVALVMLGIAAGAGVAWFWGEITA